jgi:nitrogenase molybdenum-iron protein NifN
LALHWRCGDSVEKAILDIRSRTKPDLIAICSTGLNETMADDSVQRL